MRKKVCRAQDKYGAPICKRVFWTRVKDRPAYCYKHRKAEVSK